MHPHLPRAKIMNKNAANAQRIANTVWYLYSFGLLAQLGVNETQIKYIGVKKPKN